MNIRRFRAKSVSEALEQVKLELGDDAVILKTEKRRIKGEDDRHRVVWEVAAAVDYDAVTRSGSGAQARRRPIQGKAASPSQERLEPVSLEPTFIDGLDIVSSPLMALHRVMATLGIPGELHLRLTTGMGGGATACDEKAIIQHLIRVTGAAIKVRDHEERGTGPKWWVFIGPSGSGKTTSLAKVAARLSLGRKEKGLVVSMDRYKLGGEEQLAGYARLIGIPVVKARNAVELAKVFAANREMDYIFVDTAGRAVGDDNHMDFLASMFTSVPGLKAQLVLDATTKPADLRHWIERYSLAPVEGLVVTKTDETVDLGNLWVPLVEKGLPLSYVCNGPRIPNDIVKPTKEEALRLLFAPLLSKEEEGRRTGTLSGYHSQEGEVPS